ncbi:MAG TPA: EVE domain-containing protein [Gemmatimonadales bacterium]|jgi:predicted RNA-binding protein with PUA-like domain|nr:EVE domain-containing protein [Gemmatimonadales bacterium]
MARHWILKTEPSTYGFSDLVRERRTRWEGVSNPVALKHLRSMLEGDDALIYHTGNEKALIGLARIASGPYPDPSAKDPRLVVVDIEAGQRLPRPVTLAEVKADPAFADLGLVRQGRLSVVPVEPAQWKRLLGMAGV